MPFLFNKTNANYSTSQVHGVLRLETQGGQFVAVVNSFATMQAFEENKLNWQDSYQIPVMAAGNPQEWLTSVDGPFAGGEILPEEADDLERAKSNKLFDLKSTRNQKEMGGFVYLGEVFDSDQNSYNRILGAVEIAKIDSNFEVDWTLANNSVIHLTNEQIIGITPALVAHAASIHGIYNSLKADVIEAETVDDVLQIHWPI